MCIVTYSATRGQQIVAALQAVGQGEANLMQITAVPERESVRAHVEAHGGVCCAHLLLFPLL